MPAVTRLGADDWEALRDFRIKAVTESPCAFGSSPEEEKTKTEERWREQLTKNSYYCLRERDGIVGLLCIIREKELKRKHVAMIYGVYVDKRSREKGYGRR